MLGLGKGVLGVSWVNDVEAFLIASGKSSGKLTACDEVDGANRFSDIVFNMFFPASLVWKRLEISKLVYT